MALVADLKLCRTRQAEERLKQGAEYQNFDLVFCQKNGKPLHPHNIVRRDFYAIIRRSDVKLQKAGLPGLPQISFYGVASHSCDAAGRERGGCPHGIDRLGHATPGFTLTAYAHAMPGTREKAAEASSQLLVY